MKIKKEIKIGIYVVLTLALLYWTVNFLKGKNIFGKETTYYTITESVQGLQESSHVYLRGLKIGRIDKITFKEGDNNFRIRMKINSKYNFPENSTAVIYSSDIMGTKAIKIEAGSSNNLLHEGESIPARIESDLTNIIANNIGSIRDKADSLLSQLNTTVSSINQILDEKGINNLQSSLNNINTITENFKSTSEKLNLLMSNNNAKFNNIIDNANTVSDGLKSSLTKVDTMLGDVKELTAKAKNINIDELSQSLNNMIAALNNRKGSLGKLLYNDSLYNEITESAKNMQLLLEDIKAHPKRYINISVFGRKDKSQN